MGFLRNFLFVVFVSSLAACDSPSEKIQQTNKQPLNELVARPGSDAASNAWDSHIQSAPESWVSAYQPLAIHFTHPVTGDGLPLDQHVEGVLAVEPPVAANVSFVSDRELVVRFDEPLKRNIEYKLSLFPNKLSGIKNELPTYQFSIKPYQQDFSVEIEGLKINTETSAHSITGKLTTNDADDNKSLEKIVFASQGDIELDIKWNHLNDTVHEFVISGIERKQASSEVMVSWNGKTIDVIKSGQLPIAIPSINSFNVLGAISRYGKNEFIEINFSDTIQSGQSFKGLIKIQGQEPKNVRVDGNSLHVYPKGKLSGDVSISVFEGIQNTKKMRTLEKYETSLTILQEAPGVRFKDANYILPNSSKVTFPIEAVNVDSVQITAYRMEANNLGQFLQSKNLKINDVDPSTTGALWRKTYRLPEVPKDKWAQFDIDLTEHFSEYKNDLLAFKISINKSNIILDCGEKRPLHDDTLLDANQWPFQASKENPDWVTRYYNSRGNYDWRDRENPCKDQYYSNDYYSSNNTSAFRYFHTSDIGLIAKMAADRTMRVVATDINTATPLQEVEIVAYNKQHQPVARGTTDSKGMLELSLDSAPFYLLAKYHDDIGFLRLLRQESLSTNVFDTGGEEADSGIKGFFYGERGVWRPGNDIYLTFIAHDKTGQFPGDYPLTLDFFDPKGNKFDSITHANPVNGFYSFKLNTNEDSPTGNWRAVIRYGGQYFSKVVPVETIKPNRLKIELEFPEEEIRASVGKSTEIGIFSQWLNGAAADNLKADIEMNVRSTETKISGFDGYVFDDPSRELKARKQKIYDGKLNADGKATFAFHPSISNAPGKLKLNFTTRVFEKSGNFSIQYSSIPYMPYEKLVGINVPKGSGWNDSISREGKHKINFIMLDNKGDPLPNANLDFQLYKINWRWWWDSSNDSAASYVNSSHTNRLVNVDLETDEHGRATWDLNGSDYDWGRYLLRACSKLGKHCSGQVVYLGWSYNQQKNPSGDTQLMLTMDKKQYSVGDVARLTIPQVIPGKDSDSKVLLTIESGTKILSQQWIEKDIVDNRYDINVTEEMAPNVYAHVTLIQGYKNKDNDRPVRLYGIAPILVDNQKSILKPVLTLPEKIRPKSQLTIGVSEKSGKAMTYTLAVVDEGLLGITNYKTPDPRKALFKREALGVLTWDMYDLISRSSGFSLDRLLTIGGSDSKDEDDAKRSKRRFPPVVEFLGPFELEANSEKMHRIQLPDYMGAVRVMLVAGDQSQGYGAYGSVEDTVLVTQPLTVLATLPRLLGPNETFKLPVNVFVNDASINDVNVSVEANELFELTNSEAKLSFDKPGDKIISLDIKTVNAIGTGTVTVTVTAGNESASQTINIEVRSANLPQVVSQKAVIQSGENQTLRVTPNGMLNTNTTYFEISRVPQIDLGSRMDYLIGYPHGCLEQTTSKLFPQIFLGNLLPLSDKQKSDIEHYVREGLHKYASFQTTNGDFNYWPGGNYSNQWANSYAGHFLITAKGMGYAVPASLYDGWLKAQKNHAGETGNKDGYESTDAYTLFTLAVAEAADFNAMNRLKEKLATRTDDSSNYRVARWLLATAYATAGVTDAANELLSMGENIPTDYNWAGYNYGSRLRDGALLAMTYNRTQRPTEAWEVTQDIATQLSAGDWYSTQSLAWSLMALADYFDASGTVESHPVSWRINSGVEEHTEITSPMYKQVLDNPAGEPVEIQINNQGDKPFYALLGNKGIPANTQEIANSQGITIDVKFTDMKGTTIDVSSIKQGEDFKAKVRVVAKDSHARLENLALTMVAPSGWEISNDRMKGIELAKGLEYQDIRDDRVLSYFTLGNYYWWHRDNKREISVDITLNASYAGRFYLPGWSVESMYDKKISANTVGQWVNVIPQN